MRTLGYVVYVGTALLVYSSVAVAVIGARLVYDGASLLPRKRR